MDQLALDVHIIVDPSQEHRLVAERYSGPGQPITCFREFGGDLIWMVYMDV
jgi:hypothetical protein